MTFDTILVTGASSGLGRALSMQLAPHARKLILCGRDTAALDLVAAPLRDKTELLTLVADLSHPRQREPIVQAIHTHIPDLVINNAGFGLYGDAIASSTEEQLAILEVNGCACLELTLEAAKALVHNQRKGTILNIASVAAFFCYPLLGTYAASKAFVAQFSQALDVELAPQGVRVLTTCPGSMETHFQARASKGSYAPSRRHFCIPLDKAASLIVRQIASGKSLEIIDWRFKVYVWLVRYILPVRLTRRILRARIPLMPSQGT